ncbi:MAG: hypothetical protein ACPGUV_08245 [Polyangiales bacterium]
MVPNLLACAFLLSSCMDQGNTGFYNEIGKGRFHREQCGAVPECVSKLREIMTFDGTLSCPNGLDMKVYRFVGSASTSDFHSPILRGKSSSEARQVAQTLRVSDNKKYWTAYNHMRGLKAPDPQVSDANIAGYLYDDSPFVSYTLDPTRLETSKFSTPTGVQDIILQADYLATQCVDSLSLVRPEDVVFNLDLSRKSLDLSMAEGEVVFLTEAGSSLPHDQTFRGRESELERDGIKFAPNPCNLR